MSILNTTDLFISTMVEVATIGGQPYNCIDSGDTNKDFDLEEMGAVLNYDLALIFKVADLSQPAKMSLLTFRGTEYRVQNVVLDSDNATFKVYLAAKFGKK